MVLVMEMAGYDGEDDAGTRSGGGGWRCRHTVISR